MSNIPQDTEKAYKNITHYYIDKKHYSPEQANYIAQKIIYKIKQKTICQNPKCRHSKSKHVGKNSICLVLSCECIKFLNF